MRKLIESPSYMTYDEIQKEFYGKWVFITKCNITPFQELLGGVPVVVADGIFEGHKDGFYDKFDTPEYAPRTYCDFNYDKIPGVLAFFDETEVECSDDAIRL